CRPSDEPPPDEPRDSTPAVDTAPSTPPDDDPPPDDPPPAITEVTLGVPVGCPDPGARAALGPLAAPVTGGGWDRQTWDPANRELFLGGGLLVADLDGDGRLDVLLPGEGGAQLLLQTAPGAWIDASDRLPADPGVDAVAAVAADPDADGDLDVLVTRYRHPLSWWRNLGDGRFEDATVEVGLQDPMPDRRTTTATFADVDLDGDIDLFVAAFGPFYQHPRPPGDPSLLYLNDGDGRFVAAHDWLPPQVQDGYVFVASLVDLGRDPQPELYTVHDFGNTWPNVLSWGGSLQPDDGAAGLNVAMQGMGLDLGDIDGDGTLDLVMAGWGSNELMMGSASGAWFERSRAAGLTPDPQRGQEIGWSTLLADVDNDLDLDVVEGFGRVFNQASPDLQPDEVWLQTTPGSFEPVGAAWGFDHPGQTRAVLAEDLDGDGWLDLIRRDLIGPTTLQLARCGAEAWIEVTLDDPTSHNRAALGARVTAIAGGVHVTRPMVAGSRGVLAGNPAAIHFGLGAHEQVDRLEIVWPDGGADALDDVPARRRITVRRGAR
ncbi:MAG TPA: CRTAC1 family protein, partial [Myxococcota bacterium]|nr:CRTAC1 family protein [Myxococcota bacterium]